MATNTFASSVLDCLPALPAGKTPKVIFFAAERYFNGAYGITGWVRNFGSAPRQRRVGLFMWPEMLPVAFAVSDPADGGNNYAFDNLQLPPAGSFYTAICQSLDVSTEPEIKDALTPV